MKHLLTLLLFSPTVLFGKIVLNQVGSNGKYCISTTTDDKGCISGVDQNGNVINYIDSPIFSGKEKSEIVFRNLSDAPHDMKFTGANAEDLPPQSPNGADAVKTMRVEDLSKQKISCSFHGDMLGLGYRVPGVQLGSEAPMEGELEGHRKETAPKVNTAEPVRGLLPTALADVADYIMGKGSKEDIQKLLSARPELGAKLQNARPDLVAEFLLNKPATQGGPNLGFGSMGDVGSSFIATTGAPIAMNGVKGSNTAISQIGGLKGTGISPTSVGDANALNLNDSTLKWANARAKELGYGSGKDSKLSEASRLALRIQTTNTYGSNNIRENNSEDPDHRSVSLSRLRAMNGSVPPIPGKPQIGRTIAARPEGSNGAEGSPSNSMAWVGLLLGAATLLMANRFIRDKKNPIGFLLVWKRKKRD